MVQRSHAFAGFDVRVGLDVGGVEEISGKRNLTRRLDRLMRRRHSLARGRRRLCIREGIRRPHYT